MQCDIGVIGSGVVGKAAALGFAQAGFKVTLLYPTEASMVMRPMSLEWDTRVYALSHTTQRLFSRLKVWDALDKERVAPIEAMHIFDADDTRHGADLSLNAYTAHQLELAWIVEDQTINQALDLALQFNPNVTRVAGSAISIAKDFSELVLDKKRTLVAELWIGADGAQSWLRNQAGIGFDYRSYNQSAVVANFRCSKPHHGVAHQWFAGVQGIIALLPLPGNNVSLVWSAPTTLATTLLAEMPLQLAQRLMHYCEERLGTLTPLEPKRLQSFPLKFIRPHALIGERLALVGDAAHVVHPLAGYGMNLGLADVSVLLDVVQAREAWRSCGDKRVLERYARARKEAIFKMQGVTDGLVRLFGSSNPLIQTARELGMACLNKVPFMKRQLIQRAMGI